MFYLPNISLGEIELGILGSLFLSVLALHAYRYLKSELRDKSTQHHPRTFNLTVKTTRIERTVSLSLSPRLLTVPSILEVSEKVEFTDHVQCPICSAAIPVVRVDARIIARYTCPKCGNDVLIDPKPRG